MNRAFLQMLREDPVVVTGAGAVSAAGFGVAALWDAAREGRPGGRFVEQPDGRRFPVCPVDMERARSAESGAAARRLDAGVLFALAAAREAMASAGIGPDGVDPERLGVFAGTSRGCQKAWDEARATLASGRRMRPGMTAAVTLASLSGAVAHAFQARGPGGTVSATCASGAAAVAAAAEQLLLGNAEVALAGGADAAAHPLVLAGMEAAGVLGSHEDPRRVCRPFDVSRNGLLLGEGAAFLALERASRAAARGVKPLVKLAGWAVTAREGAGRAGVCEDGAGLAAAMRKALEIAGLAAGEIDYVNAHGTGTVLNDRAEAAAMRDIFGERQPLLSGTKPVTGHCLGAAPALEAVLCLKVLETGRLPGQLCCETPDPALMATGLNLVPASGVHAPARAVMSNSAGFWGYHASLVFEAAV